MNLASIHLLSQYLIKLASNLTQKNYGNGLIPTQWDWQKEIIFKHKCLKDHPGLNQRDTKRMVNNFILEKLNPIFMRKYDKNLPGFSFFTQNNPCLKELT